MRDIVVLYCATSHCWMSFSARGQWKRPSAPGSTVMLVRTLISSLIHVSSFNQSTDMLKFIFLFYWRTCRLNSIFHYISNAAINICMHISFVHMLVLLLIKSLETDPMGQRHGYLKCDSYYHTEDTLTCSSYTCMPIILNFWSSAKIFPILCPTLYNSII